MANQQPQGSNPRSRLGAFLANTFGLNRYNTPPTQTAGVSGIVSAGGFLMSPERDERLIGDRKWKTFADLINDHSIISAGVRYFQAIIAKADWKAEAVSDKPDAVAAAEFVDEALDRMATSWKRIVRRAALYRFYGYSLQEWTAQTWDDGRIGIMDVELRPQRTIRRWDLDIGGTVQGVGQWAPQTGVELYIPRSKMLYLVDDALSDDPEGIGLLRHIVAPAARASRYLQLEGWGFETDLRGVPIGRAPVQTLKDQVKAGTITQADMDLELRDMKAFLDRHVKDPSTGYMLDSGSYPTKGPVADNPTSYPKWGFELINGGSTAFQQIATALDRLNHEMAWVLGVEHVLLGQDTGSFALAKSKTTNLYQVADSVLTEIAQSASRDIIDNLWALNGFDEDLKPVLVAESAQFKDVAQMSAVLKDMAAAGALLAPGDPAVNVMRGLIGLPDADTSGSALVDAALLNAGIDPADVGLGVPVVAKPAKTPPQSPSGTGLPNENNPAVPDSSRGAATPGAKKTFYGYDSKQSRMQRAMRKALKKAKAK